jgi:chromosome segregation ATPase
MLDQQVNDKSTKEVMEQNVQTLQQRLANLETTRDDKVQKHDELAEEYQTNDSIINLESDIAQKQGQADNNKISMDNQEKTISDAQKFQAASHAKIKKIEQDHELNLKKIEKARVVEKECLDDIDKKTEELRVVAMNLKKLEQGAEVEDQVTVLKNQL